MLRVIRGIYDEVEPGSCVKQRPGPNHQGSDEDRKMANQIMRRKVANAQGLTRYYTGKTCKFGHVAERYVASGTCTVCAILILRKRYKDNPYYERARSQSWRNLNREKARATDSRYKKENPEKRKATVNRWRQANPDKVREINRRASRVYSQKNPSALAESRRKWAAIPANKIARAVTIAAWQKANPEKRRAVTRNRRAKIAGSSGTHTASELDEILKAQGYRCAYCPADLRKVKRHVDHIMPIALGGTNDRRNLQFLCANHNRSKNARHPVAFAQSIGLLL